MLKMKDGVLLSLRLCNTNHSLTPRLGKGISWMQSFGIFVGAIGFVPHVCAAFVGDSAAANIARVPCTRCEQRQEFAATLCCCKLATRLKGQTCRSKDPRRISTFANTYPKLLLLHRLYYQEIGIEILNVHVIS